MHLSNVLTLLKLMTGVGYHPPTGGPAEAAVITGEHPYPTYIFTFLQPNQRIVDREYVYDTLLVANYDGVSYTNPEYVGFEVYRDIPGTSRKEYRKLYDNIAYAVQHVWFYNKLSALDLHKQAQPQLPDNLKNMTLHWQGLTQINQAIPW